MRLFVAVRLDPDVARAITAFAERLKTRIDRQAPAARIAWVQEDHLHITVRFIGHVDEDRCGRIHDALRPPVEVHAFEATVAGAGAFPGRAAPRVLWTGITEGVEDLEALARTVTVRLGSCGIAREDRPYRPHITVARVREPAGLRTAALFEGVAAQRFGTWRVDAITLFESRPSARGHQYVPLQRTPLAP